MSEASRKTFEQRIRIALMKEKTFGIDPVKFSRTAVTGPIKGLDLVLFFALAEFHDINDIGRHLGTMHSSVLYAGVYDDKVALSNLAYTLDKAFGTMADQGFERVCRWIDMYIDILDFLPQVAKYHERVNIRQIRTNCLMNHNASLVLAILAKNHQSAEPNRYALLLNDTVRGDDNRIDRYKVTGFRGATPVIKVLDPETVRLWKGVQKDLEAYFKDADRLFRAEPANVGAAIHRRRTNMR